MRKYPNMYKLDNRGLITDIDLIHLYTKGKYVVARPIGFQSRINAFKIAWKVFIGKADAIIWPEDQ